MANEAQNIEEILNKDPNYQEGINQYREIEKKAHEEAGKLAQKLVEEIVTKEEKFNLSIALMAVSKTLTHLASFLYDTEEEFLSAVQKARTAVVTDVIPSLLDPKPCGECEACKNGNPVECINPNIRGDYTETRFLPIIANMLIEYDMFNKILHMYALRDEEENTNEKAVKEEKKNANE